MFPLVLSRREAVAGLAALTAVTALGGLSACSSSEPVSLADSSAPRSAALTWGIGLGYDDFLTLAADTFPATAIDLSTYAGANKTGYAWAQMRADDIPDVFITSQVLDQDLARERLADLSGYDFVGNFSTALLDQVAIDGGVYLLPVCNAMYGIIYNKTLMEEKGWKVPTTMAELEALCADIRAAGLVPGYVGTQLPGNAFSAVLNLAKTDWFATPEGVAWEQAFLAGKATAAGQWEKTMDYVQRYLDMGLYSTDPANRGNTELVLECLGNREAVFATVASTVSIDTLPNGDKLGIMPYISEDGSRNIYMYNPFGYVGVNRRLTEPGNEAKLDQVLQVLSLLYSPEGQATFITEEKPCVLSVLDGTQVAEDSLIFDAQQAQRDGRALLMTFAGWDGVLADMGQAFTDWFRGENGMDAAGAIAKMDELQSAHLSAGNQVYFGESAANFTLEETARLVAAALGAGAQSDAALMPYVAESFSPVGAAAPLLYDGSTGTLYAGKVNAEVTNSIAPGADDGCVVLTMTGAEAKELAAGGYTVEGHTFPCVLATANGTELEDGASYRVALLAGPFAEGLGSFETASAEGSIREFIRAHFEERSTVAPGDVTWS